VNDLDRVAALLKAAAPIRLYRDGGVSFEEICRRAPKTCNPLQLSPRQVARIYEGGDAYSWTYLRNVVMGIDWAVINAKPKA